MDRVGPILAQFPKPVTLAASRWKWWGILAGGAVFSAAGVVEAINSTSGSISDWLGAAFFGLATAGSAIALHIGRFEITLDADAFTYRIARQSERWRWEDAGDFAVVEYLPGVRGASLRKQIGFNDKRLVKTMSLILGEGLNTVLIGRDCFLPDINGSSAYGLPMEDLALLMSQWQERALAMRRTPGTKPATRPSEPAL